MTSWATGSIDWDFVIGSNNMVDFGSSHDLLGT
jgi:hypothetical protein